MPEILVRVTAPHFVAGIVMATGRCVKAAPIMAWAVGEDASYLRKYFADKGWKASILTTKEPPP
jgi:hypothetical protein